MHLITPLHLFWLITEKFKTAMLYLNEHPILYYFLLAIILIAVGLIIFSAPKKAKPTQTIPAKKIATIASSKDISAIAGDDVISTQLDLAKAYIEMDQINLARRILNDTLKAGNSAQKTEARLLLETL